MVVMMLIKRAFVACHIDIEIGSLQHYQLRVGQVLTARALCLQQQHSICVLKNRRYANVHSQSVVRLWEYINGVLKY